MKTKFLIIVTFICVLTASCSTKKYEEQIAQLNSEITTLQERISNQIEEIQTLKKQNNELRSEEVTLSKDTIKLTNEISKLNKDLAYKKTAAERAKSKPKGRKANEAGPNDKRYTVDKETGLVKY